MKLLKKSLKNNKGVTLVELIVSSAILFLVITAFLSMVANASKMFAKGNRELDIQNEAQMVSNQIEEYIKDANLYVGQNGKSIYIVNNDFVYVYTKESDGLYYTVYNYPASQDQTSETAKDLINNDVATLTSGGTVVSKNLASNRIESITLNNDDLDTDNIVYLTMSYKNMEREIGVNETIYLRNEPGLSGGSGGTTPVDNDFDAELVVLRFKEHNLKSEFGVSSIKRNGSSAVVSGGDASKYNFDINTCTVALKSSVANTASSAGGCTVTCIKNGKDFKIRLSFDPVSIGIGTGETQTVSLRGSNVEQANDYIPIKGFDTHASGISYRITLEVSPSYTFSDGKNPRDTGKFKASGGEGTPQPYLEGDKQFNGGGYYKGVYRLVLDDRSNHLIFRQLSQCDRVETKTANKPVPIYTIYVYHGDDLLGSAKVAVNIPGSSWYH